MNEKLKLFVEFMGRIVLTGITSILLTGVVKSYILITGEKMYSLIIYGLAEIVLLIWALLPLITYIAILRENDLLMKQALKNKTNKKV